MLHLVIPGGLLPDYDQPEQAGSGGGAGAAGSGLARSSATAVPDLVNGCPSTSPASGDIGRSPALPSHRVWGEHEVDGDAQGSSERPDLPEGRRRLVGLPAADGGDVDAEQVGQVLLGHRRLHAQAKPLELLPVGHIDPPRPSIGTAYVLTR